MITHEISCPIGCLLQVTHQSQISEHYEEHLTYILKLVKYRKDDTSDAQIEVFESLITYIEHCYNSIFAEGI